MPYLPKPRNWRKLRRQNKMLRKAKKWMRSHRQHLKQIIAKRK